MIQQPDTTSETTRTVPGPADRSLWGSLRDFQADSIGFLADSVQQYGDLVRFRFGPVVAYLINRPEYVEHVLARASRCYDKHTRSVAKLRATCGDSLLSSDGEQWLRHRRLIQPVFQPQHVRAFVPTIDVSTQEMIERWNAKADSGQEIDIVSEMMRATMTIAVRALFESDIGSDTETIEHALAVILDDTWRRLENPVDLSVITPLFHRPRFRAALREIDRVVYRIIHDRRSTGAEKGDLLSRLLRAHQAERGTRLSDQELRDAVVTLLLAGHETTANALANAFYLISQAPQIENRLIAEAMQRPSDSASIELPEATLVFAEAIRIYPSIWIIERRAVGDDVIGGFAIPKGSTVILSPYLLHRHPEFWHDPLTFDPDRFAHDRSADRPRHAYIPFGLGPHRCIGEHMAMLVATRILSTVHRHFRLRLVPGQEVKRLPGITLRYEGQLRMSLHRVERGLPFDQNNESRRK